MTRKIISAAAGTWLDDNPPPQPTGRGSAAARSAYFGTLAIARTIEFLFEGGSAGYLLDNVGSKDLTNNGSAEPVHGGPPLSFASVDSVRFSQTLSYAQGNTGNDYGTGNYAFEMWWRQPPFDLTPGPVTPPPGWGQGEIFVLGVANNGTRVMLGLRYLSESNTYTGPYASSFRQGPGVSNDVNFFIPWEWEFSQDGKIHHIMEIREAATRANWTVIIDGIPIADHTFEGTGVGIIQNFDGTSARISVNGNGGISTLERSGAEFGYIAFYDNGEELTLQKVREIFEVSSLDNQNMLEIPCWIPLDSENVTIEEIKYRKITMGDVLDSTGARSGAIPRTVGRKVYFEIEILDQGDSVTAIRPGIRRMITAADVGDQTTVGEDGNEHHFYIDGTDLRVDRNTLVHGGATDQSTGRVYGFAIDWAAGGDFWVSEDGVWLQGDPETGTAPSGTLDPDTAWAAHVWNNGLDGNAVALLNADQGTMQYPIPAGFEAWVPLGLPLEPEVYGPNRRELAAQKVAAEYLKEYKFEGGPSAFPSYITDSAGNRVPYHDDLQVVGTAPYEFEPVGCELTTGDEIGVLPDSCFFGSSQFSTSYEYRDARLNNTQSWAPSQSITATEFLIIDMLEVRTLVGMQTQGGAVVAEWVITCLVEVSLDNVTYTPIVDGILNFNTDQNTVVENLITPVSARYVKFTPQTWQAFMDLRVELLVSGQQLSQASQTSVLHPNNVTAELVGNQGELDEELRAMEFHYRHRQIGVQPQGSMLESTANGNITLGTGATPRNMPTFMNNFNGDVYWESNVDTYGDDKPHQIFESCDPDDDEQGFVCLDGMPVVPDLFTGGTLAGGWCTYFNPTTASVKVNGDANDGNDDRACARYGFFRQYRGIAKQFTLMDVRRIFEAGAIIEPARSIAAGVQDGTILDAQLTASSEQNPTNRRAEDGRLYGANVWQPATAATTEWWKIDFGKVVIVDGIVLQGVPGLSTRMLTFKLEYNFDDGGTWTPYNSDEILDNSGTTNGDEPGYHKLIPFRCRYLRVRPETWSGGPAVRAEFHTQLPHTGRLQDMLAVPRWFLGDSVNCTVGGTDDKDLTCGDVLDNTGGRSGAIPRNSKVYFEVEIVAQGDAVNANLLGLRKLIQDGNVGSLADAADDGYHTDTGGLFDGLGVAVTGLTGTLANAATGNYFMFAIDWDTGDWWIGSNGVTWLGDGGAGDPASGANPLPALDTITNWAVHNRVNGASGNGQVRLRTTNATLFSVPPNGFTVWEDAL